MELSTAGGHKGFIAQIQRPSRPLAWFFESTLATTASRSIVAKGKPLEGWREGARSGNNEVNKERIREERNQAKKLSDRDMIKEEGVADINS